MKLPAYILATLAALTIIAAVPSESEAADIVLSLPKGLGVVSSGGKLTRHPLHYEVLHGKEGAGGQEPRPSPDQRLVAFAVADDVWLYDVKAKKSRRITSIARPVQSPYTSVFVLVTGWAPDGKTLLYYVDHGETTCEDCPDKGYKIPDVEYGFHAYDLTKNEHKPLKIELLKTAMFQAWQNAGSLLVTTGPPYNQELLSVVLATNASSSVSDARASFADVFVSKSGTDAIAVAITRRGQDLHSKILGLNLRTKVVTEVSGEGQVAEYYSPLLLPEGEPVYATARGTGANFKSHVTVGNKNTFACNRKLAFSWIDDQVFAIKCEAELVIYDAEKNKVKARHQLTPP